jgi:hypothetical protein
VFGTNNYCTLWGIEDKGKYSVVEMSTSRKDKETGEYTTDFSSKFVRFIGEAHNKLKKYGYSRKDRIKLTNCGVTTDKGNDDRWYTNFLVFDFEDANGDGGLTKKNVDDPYEGDNYDEDPV